MMLLTIVAPGVAIGAIGEQRGRIHAPPALHRRLGGVQRGGVLGDLDGDVGIRRFVLIIAVLHHEPHDADRAIGIDQREGLDLWRVHH